jgi:hypothetical protein
MKFDTFFHGLLRKRVTRGDPCSNLYKYKKKLLQFWFNDCLLAHTPQSNFSKFILKYFINSSKVFLFISFYEINC